MSCLKGVICFYLKRKSTANVSEALFAQDQKRFCEGNFRDCAIYRVMDKRGMLKCPKDLLPADRQKADQLCL